ncbi:tripartite tricarboxylate transporter TctB family protein [Prosthecodimorpha staleyi]|uniref:Tripartite tricarboxylate transporter TctB family protein n=1 Tax=Prosthecodimorpha staleyi TaxID=2840188 RepID=A0A947DBG2_9HYPH|nr:tripartite tricarboxylate transporter TctB family protein [Prosthecodimorpha staleyi]MBT9292617.1 tripartite tricarboxylate transporter TctB family protein [Prosthecodimorpha staleyi]
MNQSILGGIVLIALAVFAWWVISPLSAGTMRAMGPAMMPKMLAALLGLCGLLLVVFGFVKPDARVEGLHLRPAILIPLGLVVFGLTIRPFDLGFVVTPGLGLAVAGPLAMLIGGQASPQSRLLELIPLSLILTAFCIILFGDLLNLAIPVYPQALQDRIPAGWSHHDVLRAIAGAYVVLGALTAIPAFAAARREKAHV